MNSIYIESDENIKEMSKTTDLICGLLDNNNDNILKAAAFIEKKNGYLKGFNSQFTSIVFTKCSLKDIFIAYKIYFKSINQDEKILLAGTLATHIAGFIKDFDNIQGKTLTSLIKRFKSEQLDLKLKGLRTSFKSIRKIHDEMRNIRNNVSAHKERDVSKQIDIKNKMKTDDFKLITIQLLLFTYSLLNFENEYYKVALEKIEANKLKQTK